MCELTDAAEGKERTETQCRSRVSVDQRVPNQQSVLISLEDELLLQQHATDPVESCGNFVTVKLANVLMTLRAVVIALILVKSQIELSAMLNNGNVQRRQEHMVLIVELRNGYNQQSVILADVTVYNRGT